MRLLAVLVVGSPRALREYRILGVATNLAFLEAVLNHPKFRKNEYTTRFIDETPELFAVKKRRDRATKLLTYIAGSNSVGTWEASSTSLSLRSKARRQCQCEAFAKRGVGRLVLFKQPFASAAQFQSSAIDDQVKIAGLVSPALLNWQSTRPSAQRRMIRNGRVDLQHSHDRASQPFALAKRQSKHRSQSQRGFDGKVRIVTLTARRCSRLRLPTCNRIGVKQIVRLPRLRRQTSYSRQFVTRWRWRGMCPLPFE